MTSTSTGRAPSEQVLLARAYLSRIAEPGSLALFRWIEKHGPVIAAQSIRDGDVPSDVAAVTSSRRATTDAAADLEAAQRHGIRLLVPEAADWPHFGLGPLHAVGARTDPSLAVAARTDPRGASVVPPLALWVKGRSDPRLLAVRSVAIVGARAATPYGEHVTAELAYGLARQGFSIVSGGAYGIDAAAHRSALAAEGETIIVSAGGLDRPYPAGNATLFDRAADRGLLISESPPGSAPHRQRFLTRNRLIAAFSSGTVVVEAAARSGALSTAAHCVAIGRPLMAVPGPVTSALSTGCHALLRRENNRGAVGLDR